jgi:hypothetical protein
MTQSRPYGPFANYFPEADISMRPDHLGLKAARLFCRYDRGTHFDRLALPTRKAELEEMRRLGFGAGDYLRYTAERRKTNRPDRSRISEIAQGSSVSPKLGEKPTVERSHPRSRRT